MTQPTNATRLICPLTARTVGGMRADLAAAIAAGADAVEFRLDFLANPPSEDDLRRLLVDIAVDVIVTFRPTRQGGHYDGDEAVRLAVLQKATDGGATYVDVEDDVPQQDQPSGNVIVSHHDFDGCPADLDALVETLEASDAPVNKVAFMAQGPEDALRALDVVRACGKPTIAAAMGEAGLLSRILAPKLGAMGTFAALNRDEGSAPGQPTVGELKQLYRWNAQTPDTVCYGVIGCPVAHSMSPVIHNAAFAAAGLDGVYMPLLIQPGADNFNRFMDALLARPWLNWRGLSVTIPHKENALAYVGADRCDELAVRIGAINTITIDPNGSLAGDNTDYGAAIDALCSAMGIEWDELFGRAIAVLGAGGASRAIVAALAHYGAHTTIYNRTLSRAEALAEEFAARARPIADAGDLDAEIVINCTPIGMHSHSDASPLERIPSSVQVVFDTIYNPLETRLLALARQAGCLTVSGLEMFVSQAVGQFKRWTQVDAPREVMREAAIAQLGLGRPPKRA
ncbi:MAG: shikimate dehydrogenase [Planctomycetota bacterium]|jgi:3-dehydroquinate dehydratase/shikimate dehydrogenase